MRLSWDEIQAKAVAFSNRWRNGGKEKQEAQSFARAFLSVFGVETDIIDRGFENPVKIGGQGHDKYIDFLWAGQIAIEMKSKGENLTLAFNQLQNYMNHLPNQDDVPDLWLVCDFEKMRLNRRSTNETWTFKTKDLRKHIKRFANIAGYATERVRNDQVEVNVKAAEKMAKLHDALISHGYDGHDLEVYLVRLLFCLYADDTGIFPKDSFYQYIEDSKPDGSDLSDRVARLFEILNTPEEIRLKRTLLSDELRRFRYVNGGLFRDLLPMADFDEKTRQILLDCVNFDWNKISPAIFGAMFQGVMDKTQRRELGAHYTSEENILKLINPLFMDELWKEFDRVKTDPTALERFHDKISRLNFLDPACGCGNFLIITYRELRLLELEILKTRVNDRQLILDVSTLLKVGVERFYGIEREDFPCQIAQVGMWLIDHQMNLLASDQFGQYFARLPLTKSATIVNGNALRIDWEGVIPSQKLAYILGNPPFNGARTMTPEQKSDMRRVFGDLKGAGNLDYVTAWYKKSADYTRGTGIRSSFVSTNSISQGEQPAILWKPLLADGVYINFGIPTFKWSNEAKGKAAVHCVIVGFSRVKTEPNTNPYLIQGPNVLIESRQRPLCDVPEIGVGNKPIDGGNYLFTEREMNEFIAKEPKSAPYFRKWIGADEFINGYFRYCLLLKDCPPNELRLMPECLRRVEAVRDFRLASQSRPTRKLAETPLKFHVENIPTDNYIVIPEVSSEKRRYIPIGFIPSEILASNLVKIVPNATLYHFGVLTSSVHMAWARAVGGRLKSDYRYSKDIVYNNFPWPGATEEQKTAIEQTTRRILEARAKFAPASLADLYDPLTMPPELLKAHQSLDHAVMKLYGFPVGKTTEEDCVAALMERYRVMTERK
ncbi:MAG: class I SAM-dependent DNA methyltransferase [Deltaproteobacteria bacterium]|jgi:hypothetical protein|nr:class I SAM-dependent DNA methyltransferase [Deltaproteobacteria bacterium]